MTAVLSKPKVTDPLKRDFSYSSDYMHILPVAYLLDESVTWLGDREYKDICVAPGAKNDAPETWYNYCTAQFENGEYTGHRCEFERTWQTIDDLLDQKRYDFCYERIVESLADDPWRRPIYVVKTDHPITGETCLRVGNGHHRLAAAIELGFQFVPVTTDDEFDAFNDGY